jgi:hypothetical protein
VSLSELRTQRKEATKYTILSRSRSLSVLLPNTILFDGKAAKEGGRSEMKGRTRWEVEFREGLSSRESREEREKRKYGMLPLVRFLHSWKKTLPSPPCARYMFNRTKTVQYMHSQQSRVDCVKLAGRKLTTWYLRQHPKVLALEVR